MKNNPFLPQLGEYFDSFLPDIQHSSPNTIAAYADSFAVFFQFLNETKGLTHEKVTYKIFTAALFDEFLLWMQNVRQYSLSSINNRMTAITSFLKYASRREMTAVGAYTHAFGTEKPTVVRTEFPYFTLEETHILLRLPDPQKYLGDRDLVMLSLLS